VPPDKPEKIEQNFQRSGVKILLLIRWLPGIRSPMFITAGVMRLPVIRFIIADGAAAVIGHSLLFFLAYWFGDSFRELLLRAEHTVDSLIKPLLILLALSAVAGYLLYHFLRHPVNTGAPDEVPLIVDKVASMLEHKDNPSAAPEKPHALEGRRPTPLERDHGSGELGEPDGHQPDARPEPERAE
jgi:hypothetical protein